MNVIEAFKMALKLDECQESMKSLFVDEYDEKVEPYKAAIKRRMNSSTNELAAAIKLAREFVDEGHDGVPVAMTMAAAADLISERRPK